MGSNPTRRELDKMFETPPPKALTFDVFGTVTDWRSSVISELSKLGRAKNIEADWERFADLWRAGYGAGKERVRRGELPWTNVDSIHRLTLDQLLAEFRIGGLSEGEKENLNRVWHRLVPWPDAVRGLSRLRKKFVVATLSNGNVSLLVNLARYAGLPWDCILSAELVRRYKPDSEVYRMACELLGMRHEEVIMVAAHKDDLKAAQRVGMRTAFVPRPLEFGPQRAPDTSPDSSCEITARSFEELAASLGA